VNIRRGVLWDSSAILALLDADEAVLLRSIAILFSTAGLRSSVYRVDFAAAVILCAGCEHRAPETNVPGYKGFQ